MTNFFKKKTGSLLKKQLKNYALKNDLALKKNGFTPHVTIFYLSYLFLYLIRTLIILILLNNLNMKNS